MQYYFYKAKRVDEHSSAKTREQIMNNFNVPDNKFIIILRHDVVFYHKAKSPIDFIDSFRKQGSLIQEQDIKPVLVCDINELPENNRVIAFEDNNTNKNYKKVLFLGTHITKPSIEAGFFYLAKAGNKTKPLPGNSFWSLLSKLYNYDFHTDCVSVLKQELVDRHIALADIYEYCICTGSFDKEIIDDEEGNCIFNKALENGLLEEAEIVVTNMKSGKAFSHVKKELKRIGHFDRLVPVSSSSGNSSAEKSDWEKIKYKKDNN